VQAARTCAQVVLLVVLGKHDIESIDLVHYAAQPTFLAHALNVGHEVRQQPPAASVPLAVGVQGWIDQVSIHAFAHEVLAMMDTGGTAGTPNADASIRHVIESR